MQHLEGSGTPVLYTGRTVLKGWSLLQCSLYHLHLLVCSIFLFLTDSLIIY